MKKRLQRTLQRLLGFEAYLQVFARFKLATLRWDAKENDFFYFLKLLPSTGDYLDIGANLGLMTHFLALKAAQHNGRVHAFEPVPENLRTLRYVVKRYKHTNVAVHPVAVGDTPGQLTLVMPVVNGVKMQGLSHVEHPDIHGYAETANRYTAPVVVLDDFPPLKSRVITGIKLDVENFEARVILGARQLIEHHKPLIYCELWDNANRAESLAYLKSWGYEPMVLENNALQPFNPLRHTGQVFFFVPTGSPPPAA